MRTLLFATSLLLGSASLGAAQEDAATRDFLTWARQQSVPLDSLEWSETDPSAFAFLDEALQGKRVVYLGETDHFVAERMEFRLLLIRELMRRGYRRIGMEMGLSDGKRMDRYLETGDEAWLDQVGLYGYRGDLREDRVDEVPGWTDDSHPEFTKTILGEARWFLEELRGINEELPEGEPRLKWFGFDLSFRPGGGYHDAATLLAPHPGHAMVAQVQERMARVPEETRLQEADRLEALVAFLDEHMDELVQVLGDTDALDLRRSLMRMADAFRFIEAMQDLRNFNAEDVADALGKREQRMGHNFDDHLAEWPEDEKIILLGHALHLSKDSTNLLTHDYGAMWESIGTYLDRKLPEEVYGIWLLHHRGMHGRARGEPLVLPFRSPPGAVEGVLAQIHPILMLPLGDAGRQPDWLKKQRVFSHSGSPARAVLPQQVDCLFFVEEAHDPGKRVQAQR